MKKYIFSLFIIFSMSDLVYSSSTSEKMIPLEDYLSANSNSDDPAVMEYTLFRCIGLNVMQRTVVQTRKDKLAEEVLETLDNSYGVLVSIAFINYNVANPNSSFEEFSNLVVRVTQPLAQLYQDIANESWLKSGHYFSDPLIASDTKFCGSVVSILG